MKPTVILIAVFAVLLLTIGCSDNQISYPTGDGGWQIGITLSEFFPTIDVIPVVVRIRADVINLTDGNRPADGSVLVFMSSGGTFVNGLTEIELSTLDGWAETELEIQLPGTYEVEVAYPQESCSVVTVFSIGLE